jgi:NADH-quinone oxidoreductase subunit M
MLFCNIINFFNRTLNLFYFFFCFLLCFFLVLLINKSVFFYQELLSLFNNSYFNINYILGLDVVSVFFLLLCSFILSLCFLYSWFLRYRLNTFCFLLWLTFFIFVNIFLSVDFFVFFFFFELIIIPLFFFIVFEVVGAEKFMPLINFFCILCWDLFLFFLCF